MKKLSENKVKLDVVRQGILNSMASKGVGVVVEKYYTANQRCHTKTYFSDKADTNHGRFKGNKEILLPIYQLTISESKVVTDFAKISQSLEFTREYLIKDNKIICELNGCGYVDYINGKVMSAHEEIYFSSELYKHLRLL